MHLKKNVIFYQMTMLILSMVFCVCKEVQAQYFYMNRTPMYLFDLPNSLEGNEVQDILQDDLGYVWFATKSGLIQYNGRDFEVYTNNIIEGQSISWNEIEVLYQTKDGTIWIGTWGGGLNKFNRDQGTFERYMAKDTVQNTLSENFVADIVEDREGYLWIATRNGLNRLNPKTNEIKHFFHDSDDPKTISCSEIRTLYVDKSDVLWVGTGYPWDADASGGLNKYDPATETFIRYEMGEGIDDLKENKVTAIFEDGKNNFWIGTKDNHIYLMDREHETFHYQSELSDFDIKDTLHHIRSFFEAKDGSIWICSYGSGLKNYDLERDYLIDYIYISHKEGNDFSPINHAWKIYQTDEGTLWFFTGDVGEKVFKSNGLLPHLGMVWSGDRIQSIYANEAGDLWTGRAHNGLNRNNWNDWTRSRTYFGEPKNFKQGNWSFSETNDAPTVFDNLFSIIEDRDDLVWATKLMDNSGLICLNHKANTLKTYRHQLNDTNSISNDTIIHIVEDPLEQFIWMITADGVLNRLEKETQTFQHYAHANNAFFPKNPCFLKFNGPHNLLIASIEGQQQLQLTHFDTQTGQLKNYPLMRLPVPDTRFEVNNILVQDNGDIWIGTDRVLCKWSESGEVISFEFKPLKMGTAKSMLFDEKQNIWIASTMGITVFDTKTETISNVMRHLKIQSMPFFFRSATVSASNELLFCGNGGCLLINQASQNYYYKNIEQQESIESEKILITSFLLNGKEIQEGKYCIDSILTNRSLTLNHVENNFSFEFALLDFNYPEIHRFEYFLENYDNYWRKTGDKNMAYYSQIPPGDYVLKVKGYNSFGTYGETSPIQITVLAPWWRSWWAYGIYGLILFGFIYIVYRFQLNKQLAESENQRLQELDAAKTQLYTNITHEFRTPLTVILGMAQQMEGKVTESQGMMLEMISRNGKNLLNLVNQMLDLSRLESGQMTVKMQQGDIISYLKYLAESFHSFAESREVKIHFLSDLEAQNMDFDRHKIQQIISNLLSNAIKFTPAEGDIYITVNTDNGNPNLLAIKLKDTGIGIEASRLPHIFKRFYQVDDSPTKEFQGTGIGLALVYELVKLMNGVITVKSQLNKGTAFTILLPIKQEAALMEGSAYEDPVRPSHSYRKLPNDDGLLQLESKAKSETPRILVVEDNVDVRTYIRACLAEKFQLLMAENGQQGIEKAISHIPDLIISDVMMPQKDGYTLAEVLKKDSRTSHIPIILLTAKADINSKLQGLQQGADAYLAKPFNPEELLIRIDKLLELRMKLRAHYLSLTEDLTSVSTKTIEPPTTDPTNIEDVFVQKVKHIVLEHLDDFDLNVEKLCRAIGMSHSQLHRKLSALTGLSTNRFIRHIRLTKAKELLKDQTITVTAVAFDTGFNDPSYFGRVFKKEVGCTPVEWQAKFALVEK